MKFSRLDPKLIERAQMLDMECQRNGYELNINYLSVNEANFILDILGYYWGQMEGNEKVQNETHRVANVLRRSVGIEEVAPL